MEEGLRRNFGFGRNGVRGTVSAREAGRREGGKAVAAMSSAVTRTISKPKSFFLSFLGPWLRGNFQEYTDLLDLPPNFTKSEIELRRIAIQDEQKRKGHAELHVQYHIHGQQTQLYEAEQPPSAATSPCPGCGTLVHNTL